MTNPLLPGYKFQVQDVIYDPKTLLDETNFYNQRQGSPSELTKKITFVLGKQKKKYPIMTQTLGGIGYGNANSATELDDVQFTYPLIGRLDKANPIFDTIYADGDQPGIGNSALYLIFSDNMIKRQYKLHSPLGYQVYVDEITPEPTGGYRYKCYLDPAGPLDFLPPSETYVGASWAQLFAPVAESESRTTESTMVMPGLFKNQMSFIRKGISWAGNAANKMMKITMENEKGQTSNVWMDYAMWQFEDQWMGDMEHLAWYSKYNRQADGTINLKDQFTQKVIPIGSGVLEQIGNRSTYTEMTRNKLFNTVGDALFGQDDTEDMVITLMGGTGARREFDNAIRNGGGEVLSAFGVGANNIADKFVTGTGRNLALGGYFDTYYHIDGYTICFKFNPMFDNGRIALNGPKHPKTGLPLESYRMVFIDNSDVDGQPNLRHVAQKGRSFLHGVQQGLTPMPKGMEIATTGGSMEKGKLFNLSTDQDKSSYTRLASFGIQIMRANRCFDLQCVAGL